MKRPTIRFLCLFLLSLVLFAPQNGSTCGPEFPDAVFTWQAHPDAPLAQYAHGNLGVILPSFARSYLVVGYRYLSSRPLTPGEQNGALKYWLWKLRGSWGEPSKDPTAEWSAARTRIVGKGEEPAGLAEFRSKMTEFINPTSICQPDAFHTAALTLKDRTRRFGAKSTELREWIRGQDVVFSNCDRGPHVPAMVEERSPALLKADRRYQIAAAHFYAGDFITAIKEFDQITQDKGSPWHIIAPYLAARSSVRRRSDFADAKARLQPILRDNTRRSIHRAVRKLLGYIAYHVDPERRTHELARVLAGPRADPDFEQDIIDYTFGLDRWMGDYGDQYVPDDTDEKRETRKSGWEQKHYRELSKFAMSEELTDWIFTFKQSGEAGRTHAINRWRQHHTLPWLVAAIAKVDAGDKVAPELVHAAEQAPSDSPAYATLAYHRVRLLLQTGEQEKARALLAQLLPELEKKISTSSFNLFLGQRMKVITNFEDFLAYASRPSVGDDSGEGDVGDDWLECGWNKTDCAMLVYGKPNKNETPLERRFDLDAALILNMRLPLELLAQAEASPELPENLRKELAVSVFTRAAILGRHDIAATFITDAARAYPVMKNELESYANATSPQDKWRAALFTVLHFPGVRPYVNARSGRSTPLQKIDNYRDNWWCKDIGSDPDQTNYMKDDGTRREFKERHNGSGFPAFLSADQIGAAKSEWKTLVASGSAADYLPQQTLKWARDGPDDPRIPEALHLAVRVTRYGCDGDKASKLSKEAFNLLHNRYPNSKWAKETPYWF
jgi:hypothetical protein